MSAERGYRPIGDYAVIGNGRTVALVASDTSIDWLCLPDIDSDAVFCRLLDERNGGSFRVGPTGEHSSVRSYLGDTNVLVTTFTTGTGVVQVTDLMPAPDAARPAAVLRRVGGIAGSVDVEIAFRPTRVCRGTRRDRADGRRCRRIREPSTPHPPRTGRARGRQNRWCRRCAAGTGR